MNYNYERTTFVSQQAAKIINEVSKIKNKKRLYISRFYSDQSKKQLDALKFLINKFQFESRNILGQVLDHLLSPDSIELQMEKEFMKNQTGLDYDFVFEDKGNIVYQKKQLKNLQQKQMLIYFKTFQKITKKKCEAFKNFILTLRCILIKCEDYFNKSHKEKKQKQNKNASSFIMTESMIQFGEDENILEEDFQSKYKKIIQKMKIIEDENQQLKYQFKKNPKLNMSSQDQRFLKIKNQSQIFFDQTQQKDCIIKQSIESQFKIKQQYEKVILQKNQELDQLRNFKDNHEKMDKIIYIQAKANRQREYQANLKILNTKMQQNQSKREDIQKSRKTLEQQTSLFQKQISESFKPLNKMSLIIQKFKESKEKIKDFEEKIKEFEDLKKLKIGQIQHFKKLDYQNKRFIDEKWIEINQIKVKVFNLEQQLKVQKEKEKQSQNIIKELRSQSKIQKQSIRDLDKQITELKRQLSVFKNQETQVMNIKEYINNSLQQKFQIDQKVSTIQDLFNNFSISKSTLFTASQILHGKSLKLNNLQTIFSSREETKIFTDAKLIYRYDKFNNQFLKYFQDEEERNFSFVILFKLADSDWVCGIFSQGFCDEKCSSYESFMFCLEGQGRIFGKNSNVKKQSSTTMHESWISFGNNELKIKNYLKNAIFELNSRIFGDKYYGISNEEHFVGKWASKREIPFEEMEIFRLCLDD